MWAVRRRRALNVGHACGRLCGEGGTNSVWGIADCPSESWWAAGCSAGAGGDGGCVQDASGGERGWQRSGQGWGVQGWAEQGSCVVERAGRGVWYGLARGWRVGDAWGLRAKWAWEGLGCGSGSRDERRWGPRGDVRRSDGRISRGWSSGAGDRGGAAGGRDDGVGERRGGGVGDGGGAASGESTSNGAGSSGDATHANYGAVPWLFKATPQALHPYWHLMRLDKPTGTWLLAWPCMWSITLACPPGQIPDFGMMALFGAGAVLLRGAGCTVNDLWDRDLDRRVSRTRTRPLASGAVSPLQATAFLGAQLLSGLVILLQLNPFSQALGASSLLLVCTYPFMKRVTWWPQAFLGLTINWGALLGWAAVDGSLHLPATLPLYVSGACWTLAYDTIYAHQDKRDDEEVGIKSTARRFGANTKPWLSLFAAGSALGLTMAGAGADAGVLYYGGVALGTAHLAWQIATVDLDDPRDCMAKFASNRDYGAIVFAGALGDRLVAAAWGG